MIDNGQKVRWGCSADLRTIGTNFKHEIPVPLADAIAGWLFDHVFPWVEHYAVISNLGAVGKDQLLGWVRRDAERGNPQAQKLLAEYLGILEERERDKDFTPADYATAGRNLLDNLRSNLKTRGLCPVCHRPTTVPTEVCEDSASGNGQDNQVVGLAVPCGPTGNSPCP